MIRNFAYRCGGSAGIAVIRLTVFPFNPLTEQSKGHLQTSGAGWLIQAGLSSRGVRDLFCSLLLMCWKSLSAGNELPTLRRDCLYRRVTSYPPYGGIVFIGG